MRVLTDRSRKLLGMLLDITPPKLGEAEATVIRQRFGIAPGGTRETLQVIADRIGVTRERVRQIEAKGLRKLGNPVLEWEVPPTPLCKRCGSEVEASSGGRYQPVYCSPECRSEPPVTLTCHWCEKTFTKPAHVARGSDNHPGRKHPGRWFCSHSCQGRYLGSTHGFGIHPENAGRGPHPGAAALSRRVIEAARATKTEDLPQDIRTAMDALAAYEEENRERRRTG